MPAPAPVRPAAPTDDTAADAPAFAAARAVCRRHARSFYFASTFLPKPKRDAAYAVYAFCRMMDDAIDADDDAIEGASGLRHHPVVRHRPIVSHSSDPTKGPATSVAGFDPRTETTSPGCCSTSGLEQRLQLFRDRLDEIYAGRLELPAPAARSEPQHALHAFARTVARYQIPQRYFLDLAEGCRMDLAIVRYPTWASLERYCYHVAGVVGLVMSCVFGLTHPDAQGQAVQMGNAMQLTNILRDVPEDWAKGRVYLPLEDMARFRYSERDLAAGVVNDNFRALMAFEVARARDLYTAGAAGLCRLADDGSRLTAATMAVVYAGILDAIERRRYDVFGGRAHLTTAQKLRRLPGAWRLTRRRDGEPVPAVFGEPRSALPTVGN